MGTTAAGGAALDAEDRAEGGLAQAQHRVLAEPAQGVLQADGRGRLALARRRGVDGRHEDELALHGLIPEGVDVHLRLVVSVELELLRAEAGLPGHLGDVEHRCLLRDLDV